MKKREAIDAIILNFIWASNHKDEMLHVIKIHGKANILEKEDELVYFWGTSEGIQLCMWFASLFCVIESIKNMLNIDIFNQFPILLQECYRDVSVYSILKNFRNYCFHIDKSHVSDNFFQLTFWSNSDTFAVIFDLHSEIDYFLRKEKALFDDEFKEKNPVN